MNILKKIKEKGIKNTVTIIKRKCFERHIVIGYSLDLQSVQTQRKSMEYRLDPFSIQNINEMYNMYSNEITPEKFNLLIKRTKNRNGVEGYIVKNSSGELLGYFHTAIVDVRDNTINYNVKVNKDSIYLFDDYTFLKHRAKGVHKFAVAARVQLAIDRGYKQIIVNIMKNNAYSEKSYLPLGFRPYIKYYYIRLWEFSKTIVREV